MRAVLACCILCLFVGCAPIDPPKKSDPPAPPVSESKITVAARSAFKTRDADYAEQLETLANDVDGGAVKFDAKLKQRLDDAREHAGDAGSAALAPLMASEFGPNALAEPAKVSQSLRDLAKALK